MYDYLNEAQCACQHYDEKLRKEHPYIPSMQPKQPNRFHKLHGKIANWAIVITQEQRKHAKSTGS